MQTAKPNFPMPFLLAALLKDRRQVAAECLYKLDKLLTLHPSVTQALRMLVSGGREGKCEQGAQ